MWLKCIILWCAAYETISQEIVTTTITSISTTEITLTNSVRAKPIAVLEVCYTIAKGEDDGIEKTTLLIGRVDADGHHIESVYYEHVVEYLSDPSCKYFEGVIPETYFGEEVVFSLNGQAEHVTVAHTEAAFTFPGTMLDASAVSTSQNVGAGTSLRFTLPSALEVGWSICGKDGAALDLHCDTDTGLICYALDIGAVAECSLCLTSTSGEAVYKAVKLTVTDVTDNFPTDDPSEVLLTYTTLNKNALKITPKTTVANLEFVSYIDGETVYNVCVGEGKDCELGTYEKGNKEMSILLVDTATPKSSVITFTDYNIEGTKLGSDIIEMYWPRDAITKVGAHKYFDANIGTADGTTPSVQTVLVDCSRDDPVPPTYCYAYFFSLTPKKEYLVTVTPNEEEGETWHPIMTNQIRPKSITTDALLLPVGKSTSISEITLVQNPGHAEDVLQVCYRAPENNHNYTRYEAILIDEDGHWMKIYESNQEKNMMHCFVPVNVLNTPLRVTNAMKLTVVVVEREIRGNRVLASGQADIDLSALRAIKPEVDNGNSGSTSTLAIVGAAIAGIACLMALVAAAVMFVVKMNRNNNGLQYPLHRNNIEDSSINHGLDNPIPTM